jgi:hypothetical protein
MITVEYKKNGSWSYMIEFDERYRTKAYSEGYPTKEEAELAASDILKHLRHLDKINVKR